MFGPFHFHPTSVSWQGDHTRLRPDLPLPLERMPQDQFLTNSFHYLLLLVVTTKAGGIPAAVLKHKTSVGPYHAVYSRLVDLVLTDISCTKKETAECSWP